MAARQDAEQLDVSTRRQLLDAAFRQTRRIERLATGLLDLDRVEAGRLNVQQRAVDVAEAAREASYLGDADVRITVDDVQVWADPDRLEQILVNLLTNALRHGRPPIEITADRHNHERAEIAVRDHGPGVPPDQQPSLFEHFSTTDTAPGSVGLGLWIVRQLVEAHDGTIRYQPADPGARFVVQLPRPSQPRATKTREPTASVAASPAVHPSQRHRTRPRRVLARSGGRSRRPSCRPGSSAPASGQRQAPVLCPRPASHRVVDAIRGVS